MSEHTEQAALFEWAQWAEPRLPELRYLFAVPNGGKRDKVTAARLKEEGVKAGVPDVWLPVARQGFHGLVLEMKYGKNAPTEEQTAWLAFLYKQGYSIAICYGWTIAAICIVSYLGANPLDFGLGRTGLRVGEEQG